MAIKSDLIAALHASIDAKGAVRATEDETRHAAQAQEIADLQAKHAADDQAVIAARAAEDATTLSAIVAITAYAPDGVDFTPAAA